MPMLTQKWVQVPKAVHLQVLKVVLLLLNLTVVQLHLVQVVIPVLQVQVTDLGLLHLAKVQVHQSLQRK